MISLNPGKELEFKRPFTSVVKQHVTIKNTTSDTNIAFKVKTTTPKQYCVRPNAGRIAPGETAEVQILMQAMKEDPPADKKCKDKFLIQSIKVPRDTLSLEGEALNTRLSELWSQVDAIKKEDPNAVTEIMEEHKLPVVYGFPEGTLPNIRPTSAVSETSPRAELKKDTIYQSPSGHLEENHINVTSSGSGGVQDTSKMDKELKDAKDVIKKLTMACDGYRSEIDRLNALRLRKAAATSTSSNPETVSIPSVTQQYPQPGLPIQMVALVVLIAFLLGAIFF